MSLSNFTKTADILWHIFCSGDSTWRVSCQSPEELLPAWRADHVPVSVCFGLNCHISGLTCTTSVWSTSSCRVRVSDLQDLQQQEAKLSCQTSKPPDRLWSDCKPERAGTWSLGPATDCYFTSGTPVRQSGWAELINKSNAHQSFQSITALTPQVTLHLEYLYFTSSQSTGGGSSQGWWRQTNSFCPSVWSLCPNTKDELQKTLWLYSQRTTNISSKYSNSILSTVRL